MAENEMSLVYVFNYCVVLCFFVAEIGMARGWHAGGTQGLHACRRCARRCGSDGSCQGNIGASIV